MSYRRGKHAVYLCNYHFVWIPKRRKPVLVGPIKERFEELVREIAEEYDREILALETRPDHVHLFISVQPEWSPHRVLRRIKGRTSGILRSEFPELLRLPSLWTRNYFVSTAGHVSSEAIKRYIEEQGGR